MAGQKLIKSGLLQDVLVTPDPHTNSLLVTAPADSMDLMAALIKQLDTPTAVAQIKVFSIVNGDATSLVEMLRVLLPAEVTVAGPQLAAAEGETNLVPVRFSVDARTNSIIATGSQDDLAIIEALLLRLDEEDVQQRMNTVYRLKNSPATTWPPRSTSSSAANASCSKPRRDWSAPSSRSKAKWSWCPSRSATR